MTDDATAPHERAEQVFFTDPALDRAFGVVMALATELQVLRDRVAARVRPRRLRPRATPTSTSASPTWSQTRLKRAMFSTWAAASARARDRSARCFPRHASKRSTWLRPAKLAAKMSADAALSNLRFRQADAARTAFAAGAFDLLTSTMLLHELPPPAIKEMLAESARVLAPGGWMFHLDFLPAAQPRADAFMRFIHHGHARRNNEPFMRPLTELDLPALLRALGFERIEMLPFEEADGVLAPDYPHWRFPWTVIRARKAVPTGARAAS